MNVQITCHILHIACTCISLGGLFYSRMVLIPNMKHIPETARENYMNKMVRRFSTFKWTGIIILFITGIVQWLDIYPNVTDKTNYMLAFIFKMLAATGLLTVTSLLALPGEKLNGIRKRRSFWVGVNLLCGLAILICAALMREIRNGNFQ